MSGDTPEYSGIFSTVFAKEMVRVLKPGGRIATAVWNVPEKNFWATAILSIINKNMQLLPPPQGAPDYFI